MFIETGGIEGADYISPSCVGGGGYPILNMFVLWRKAKCAISNCGQNIRKSDNEACRNYSRNSWRLSTASRNPHPCKIHPRGTSEGLWIKWNGQHSKVATGGMSKTSQYTSTWRMIGRGPQSWPPAVVTELTHISLVGGLGYRKYIW